MNYKTWIYIWQIVNIYPYVVNNIISVNNIFCTPPENIMSMFTLPNAKVFQSSPGVKIFLKVFLQEFSHDVDRHKEAMKLFKVFEW